MFFHRGPFGWAGPGVFGWLAFAVLVALLALAVVLVVRSARERPWTRSWAGSAAPGHPEPALAELRMRYARGEISREEYFQRAGDLGAPGSPPPPPP